MCSSAASLGVRRFLREAETREREREREAEEILGVVVERVLPHVLLFERLMMHLPYNDGGDSSSGKNKIEKKDKK